MSWILIALGALFSLILLAFGGLWLLAGWSQTHPPSKEELENLAFDPGKPNYVSSQSSDPSRRIEPFLISGDPESAWMHLKDIVSSLPLTRIVRSDPDRLHAECSSPFFGFVDDLIFVLDRNTLKIDLRSSSRVGYSDMGANAERVDQLRAEWKKQPAP